VKKILLLLMLTIVVAATNIVNAQCSICTKTAQQLGEKPAKGMNSGILYLAFAPLLLGGFIGYKWWKHNRDTF
jgi:hypothetical protein